MVKRMHFPAHLVHVAGGLAQPVQTFQQPNHVVRGLGEHVQRVGWDDCIAIPLDKENFALDA